MERFLSCFGFNKENEQVKGFTDRFPRLFKGNKKNILVVGLDSAGKSTLVYKHLKVEDDLEYVPTIGFNIEKSSIGAATFIVFDYSPNDRIKELERYYYKNVASVVVVVDSADPDRFPLLRKRVAESLSDDLLRYCPVLILVNKLDRPNSLRLEQVAAALRFEEFTSSDIILLPCNSKTGEGLNEFLTWIDSKLKI